MNRWETGRLEAFSDGVFAIAITLLVLELNIPESEFGDLWRGFAHQWPSYLAYVTSFVTIGGIWMLHHAVFRRLRFANTRIMRINLLLLMAVSFLPFPTRLVAEGIRHAGAERAAVVIYGASLLLISSLYGLLALAISRNPDLLQSGVDVSEVKAIIRSVQPNIGFYVALIVLAGIAPKVAAFGFLISSLGTVLRARGDSGDRDPTAGLSPG
jgi:TMEM175 potassium channel family protein